MENKIKHNLKDPEALETIYRQDKKAFTKAFEKVYSGISDSQLAGYWKVRLDFEKSKEKGMKIRQSDIIAMIVSCIITGILIKLPEIININIRDFLFYEKNAGVIVFFGLSMYIIWTGKIVERNKLPVTALAFLVPAVYINLLPSNPDSQSINLAYIHLPLLMWCLYGIIFTDFAVRKRSGRIGYIKYNGDLAIMGAIILLAGMALTGITVGLFTVIDVNIENFYLEYIVVWGLVSAPIVATYIIRNASFVTNKIAPIIANLFSPLVLITLVIYLITIPVSGKDPYNDRDFLIVFNLMLIGVMAIVVFAISETSVNRKQKFNEAILFALAIVTMVIDLIALSAIFYRLGEYGLTPNRAAVLGSNLLIFGNLVLITIDLFRVNFRQAEITNVEITISKYLPVYAIWTLIVVFGFPVLFGFV
ncbi:MAG: hypothetical protein PVF73_02090 [Bacteroidales bacterium]|jgi:hypothetical protein